MNNVLIALVFASGLLSGCGIVTMYQPLRPSGGYYELPLSDGRLQVVIASNGSRIGSVLDLWLLHRCAQLTLDAGYSHFRVIEKGERAPGANEYGSYRTAVIEMLKGGSGRGEVYEASGTAARTAEYLQGPQRYQ
jgi:hypothetical protein